MGESRPELTARLDATLLLLADVGGESYHVGDEAMLLANLDRLRALAPTLPVEVIGHPPDAAQPRLPDLARGLFVSGGGNLSASWPGLLRQRIELIGQAARRGLPVVTGGQTLGPDLGEGGEVPLGAALRMAAQLGLRELPSLALARRLGVGAATSCLQVDDAFLLRGEPPADRSLAAAVAAQPILLVTLDASLSAAELQGLAPQLARFSSESGLALAALPHVGPLGAVGDADGAAARTLGGLLQSQGLACAVLPVQPARQAAWLTRQATLVLASRYHPLVFATGAAVPCLGLHRDAYTRIKLQGALAHVGLADWTRALADAVGGGLLGALRQLWHAREELRAIARAAHAGIEAAEAQRWRLLLGRLGLSAEAEPPSSDAAALAEQALAALARERSGADEEQGRLRGALRRLGAAVGLVQARGPAAGRAAAEAGPRLTEEQWAGFQRDGFVRLGPVVEAERLGALRRRADDLALGRSRNPAIQLQLDTGGDYESLPGAVGQAEQSSILYRKIQGLESDDLFAGLLHQPLFRDLCARIYGAHAPISIFRAMVMNKPAGQGTLLPWHQDGGDVWALDRDPLLTAWVALDAATQANGCMEVVPGSHRLGLLSRQGSTLAAEAVERHCPPDRVRPLELEAGHAVVFHNWLIHRSGVNPTAGPRRAFTACFMDGRTLSILTGNAFPLVAGELPGEPYPYVWQLRGDNAVLRASLDEATTYARSLEREVARLRDKHAEVERYALSLAAERERFAEMERYALSLVAEREALRASVAAPPAPEPVPPRRGRLRLLRRG
jgi:phytanoyl-CoA hydroxylase